MPPKLLKMITSFHEGMQGTVQYDGLAMYSLPHSSGIFFSLLLSYALSQSEDGVYLHTRSDGNLFNLTRLPAKTKVRKVLLRDTLRVPYSDSSAPSHTLVACLVSPLVSRRPTSLAKTSAAHQVSPLATTLSKWWRTSLT